MNKQLLGTWAARFFLVCAAFLGALLVFRFWILPEFNFSGKDNPSKQAQYNPKVFKEGREVQTRMANIFFRLSDNLTMHVDSLEGKLLPRDNADFVDFDDIRSFSIEINQASVRVPAKTMAHLFNHYVFNFDNSPLRNINLQFIKTTVDDKEVTRLKVAGEMKMGIQDTAIGAWFGFEMISRIIIDKASNRLVIESDSIKSLGNPYTKTVMGMLGLKLESLMKIPPERGIEVKGNRLFIEPFKIFPPPTLWGKVKMVTMNHGGQTLDLQIDNGIKLNYPGLPYPAENYLQIRYGSVSFGRLVMHDAELMMVDMDSSDPFDFYLSRYFETLSEGRSKILSNGSVLAFMPDYGDAVKKK